LHIAPGVVTLEVGFHAPPSQKFDEQFGPSTRLSVSASPDLLLRSGAGDSTDLQRIVVEEGSGVLQVTATAATCDAEGDHPACHLLRQDWRLPVIVEPGGETTICLVLHDAPA
jgi:hypothetical protein